MIKRFAYAAALAGVSLLTMGCSWGSLSDGLGRFGWWQTIYNTKVDSWPRIIGAIVREDLLG